MTFGLVTHIIVEAKSSLLIITTEFRWFFLQPHPHVCMLQKN